MINPKLVKFAVKGALSLAISAAIGYTIKLEKLAEERIDEHFESKDDTDN